MTTVSLHYSILVSLHDSILVSLHGSILVSLHDSIPVSLHDSILVSLHDSILVSLHGIILVSLHDSILVSLHDSIPVSLHDSILVRLLSFLDYMYHSWCSKSCVICSRIFSPMFMICVLLLPMRESIMFMWQRVMYSIGKQQHVNGIRQRTDFSLATHQHKAFLLMHVGVQQ